MTDKQEHIPDSKPEVGEQSFEERYKDLQLWSDETPETKELDRALMALRLEVPESIASDIWEKWNAVKKKVISKPSDAGFSAASKEDNSDAVEFVEWINTKGIYCVTSPAYQQKGCWFQQGGEGFANSTDELYQLFKQSKQQAI